ncbi:exonuclease domain-containing protein [Ectopseudomonas mendocina]|uniref:Exonuclease domain-containing protein n=1 Tax=Ectopseudomonas mendocina TaxID=300 RepID=A0ABZ2RKE9_ECTME
MSNWLVIDLEATTEEGGWPVSEMEIIEIGACIISDNGHELGQFQRLVRPTRRPQLTQFCQQLTHISQSEIDSAAPLPQVWSAFELWLSGFSNNLTGWVSWGDYDRKQLVVEWRQHKLSSALEQLQHYNLKQRFASARHLTSPVSLKNALQLAGLTFNGQQHRALTDARNTARLVPLAQPF